MTAAASPAAAAEASGCAITSDAGLLTYREPDDTLRVTDAGAETLADRGDVNAFDRVAAAGQGTPPGRAPRVLLVSYSFPPSNAIGAIRVGHFARSLYESGYDIRVLAAQLPEDRSLPLGIPADLITRVPAPTRDETLALFIGPLVGLRRRFRRRAQNSACAHAAAPAPPPTRSAALAGVGWRRHYSALAMFPEKLAPWVRPATAAGSRLVKDWRPDIILASAPPNAGLIAAGRIARICGAPWVADLRDLWSDNSYYCAPRWRLWLDWLHERSVLRSAAGLVTVSPIWAEILRRKYEQPVASVLNGFISEDFSVNPAGPGPGEVVSIRHTGSIYAGYRDPAPLFRAIGLLSPVERRKVAVHFFGLIERDAQIVRTAAADAGVSDRVLIHGQVPYRESLSLQQSADILLLLNWNDARDAGMIPAKFFEYLGAGRPILFIGYEYGDLAHIIRERGVGVIANDPPVIAEQLRRWIEQRPAGIASVPVAAREGLSRGDQYRTLERFLAQFIR